jgi:hypothetical protein
MNLGYALKNKYGMSYRNLTNDQFKESYKLSRFS